MVCQIRSLDPRPAPLPPGARTTPPRWSGTWPWPSGSPCTAPTRGCSTWGPRAAAAGSSPRRGCATRLGFEDLHSLEEVVGALARLRAASPGAGQALVKLNEGVSGGGNALVDLGGLPPPGSAGEPAELGERARAMRFELPDMPFDGYVAKLAERGGIVEELISGVELRSPSVQLRVTPLGEVELLSTHDQLLGGPSGQSYLGCRFPADFAYARAISADAATIGRRLAREGVLGRFAIDFVVGPRPRPAPGRRTPSSSTSARAAPPTRS